MFTSKTSFKVLELLIFFILFKQICMMWCLKNSINVRLEAWTIGVKGSTKVIFYLSRFCANENVLIININNNKTLNLYL